ncbi:MAG: ABC transporter ATP-binding protein [Rhodospirillales bacterium]|jgi:peptide/nickel transport system ATP-binding protein|nr:ABC transporter ATP-binding protein [Rhodospirillales bacterium]|tara:strand:+ start:3767 stop:5416 length:1650 start_codon:yes stop_codon:yes gene_type:complete
MLDIEDLQINFDTRRGQVKAVQGISLRVERGEILGLVGESGAGKSTVGSAVMGLLDIGGRVTSGRILFEGENLLVKSSEAMRKMRGRRIGMIFQDPMTALNPVLSIADQMIGTIRLAFGLNRSEALEQAVKWLDRMSLPDPATRIHHYPHEFSGGQRQRIVIALALCGKPDLVIADEPTTALDVSVQAQILDLIRSLVRENNIGVILITHNMGVVSEVTDNIAIMRHGKLVETGPTRNVLMAPETAYAKMLIGSVPPSDKRLNRLPVPDNQGNLVHSTVEDPRPFDGRDMILQCDRLSVTYYAGGKLFTKGTPIRAVKDTSFGIPKGHSLGLVGESGSGKSTCARAIVGLNPLSGGSVRYREHILSNMSERKRRPLRSAIQMIFQDPYSSINKRMKIFDIIAEPIRFYGFADSKSAVLNRVTTLIERVGLSYDALQRYPHQFSGGQRQRIAIARTLACQPKMIVCDEPTSALDVSVQAQILNLIKDLQDEFGLTLLFISHDLPVVRQMCDEIAVLKDGQIVEMAPAGEIFESPRHEYTKHLINLMPRIY